MKILGINCAGRWTNVGLAIDGKAAGGSSQELGRRQSEELPIIAAALLEEAGITFAEIDRIAVGTGPGYYTGIRAGIAYGAALAEALRVPVVPLSSLEIFIWDLKERHDCLAPVFKAKRGHCYAAVYDSLYGRALVSPRFVSEDALIEILRGYPGAAIVSPDIGQYAGLRECGHAVIERESADGAACALMGEFYSDNAVSPRDVRGQYLREPDIGPCD
ncbi:tRNA (adenosine(37)-N6)-threonylcarbamoyltransferase complex dimerization subunit type 1 TsaB [Cloacibacillus evryensis]|uniref:tRNA (Adenosine(37)-N6)-threonylcarbamoyltransferase complex dimerization subunit type 1 TsaB n=1 Tax=Cloacibacillus evryensis TaxID=508460 RepID=A0AAW5K0M5_9BACT|nr:tRNA (adenosine(37)-N6)-threonylcarbamoyltransferase complex dimerization subunit type 1 TsaB [Cloacibacillus evryensis]EHL65284.1 universal bacterial protein YeaZ [Synergistes sp. 3_1_syn1]MCQ4814380.1 tRNA (adenosine(37)-N6)-threonylcarbamoyltransferase complex dimerization subunit type 1 TsaB [Cloacibacillus evryensis]